MQGLQGPVRLHLGSLVGANAPASLEESRPGLIVSHPDQVSTTKALPTTKGFVRSRGHGILRSVLQPLEEEVDHVPDVLGVGALEGEVLQEEGGERDRLVKEPA